MVFRSTSNGTPDWSFPYPVSDPNLPASSRKVATSRDGSTIAAVVSDSVTQNSTLYVFDANTGAVTLMWTDPLRMNGVALTDNGSLALVTQDNRATLVETSSGNIVFTATGSGGGSSSYPMSGDGSVFAVGGFNFDVYAYNGTTYNRVIHLTRANFWFGGKLVPSRMTVRLQARSAAITRTTGSMAKSTCLMFQPATCLDPILLAARVCIRERRLAPARTTTAWLWPLLPGARKTMTGQKSWYLTVASS